MPTHRFLKIACLAPVAAALAVPAGAGAALPGAGHGFGGLTDQPLFASAPRGGPVELTINRDGKRVAHATATLLLSCSSGGTVVVPDRYRSMKIGRNRAFHASFTDEDGSSGSIHGSFNRARTKASGTWSLTEVFTDTTGTETCKSGKVKWSVKR